jgi:1-deoxy-D-xylulose-5-phosphate synthase
MAAARDLKNDSYHVVSVIGDGSIAGGMALEGLNNAAHLGSRLVVILNDNGMSISPTVGGMAKLLHRVRFNTRLLKATEKGKRFITSLPRGDELWQVARRLKSGFKGLLLPTVLWEELGFAYMGPVNGHDITKLESILAQARDYRHRPVLVHVITTKGKGYGPAEDDAVCFHGVSPSNGEVKIAPSYSRVFAETMKKIMRHDPGVVVITAAMPEGNCLTEVQQEFPKRVFDVGICEQHAVTFAAGLASQGIKPVVAIYSTFLQRGIDQIIHDVCLQKLPVAFALDRAGIVGDDGKTHQGIFDLSYLTLIPNLAVAAPADENELQHLLFTAVYCGQAMAVRYPRGSGLGVPMECNLKVMPLGEWQEIRAGSDVVILAAGMAVSPALGAARQLAIIGVDACVVNCRFVTPLDTEMLSNLSRTSNLFVSVEENVQSGGFGSAVASFLQRNCQGARLHVLGIPDEFVEHGPQSVLRARYHLDCQGIASEILIAFPELKKKHAPHARI